MPDELDAYLDPPAKPRSPRERVHSIASRINITPDLADDYLKVTQVESGHNVNVRDSSKGAKGFGQVMPDRPGATTRTISGRRYNLKNPDENIEAGLKLFSAGGSDPVARRLEYFGGPGARRKYERTGRIPNISDGNMTAAQYVRATSDQRPKSDLDSYLDPPSEQTPPRSGQKGTINPPASPEQSQNQSAPDHKAIIAALNRTFQQGVKQVKKQARQPQVTGSSGIGELRRIEGEEGRQRQQLTTEARSELRSRRGPYGSPTLTGALNVIGNPVGSFSNLLKSDDQIVDEMVNERLKQQSIARDPEVIASRKAAATYSPAARSVISPLGRGAAGVLHLASGLSSLGGYLPKGYIPPADQLSTWAKRRAEIIDAAASNAPLTEEGQEIERGVPEKVATGIADLGVSVASIIALKKATKLPFNQLLALEGALKTSDKPLDQQVGAAVQGYTLGTALEKIPGRLANAAISGVPAAGRAGYEVSQGRMSPLDAAIQTGIEAGAGALLVPRRSVRGPAKGEDAFHLGSRWRLPNEDGAMTVTGSRESGDVVILENRAGKIINVKATDLSRMAERGEIVPDASAKEPSAAPHSERYNALPAERTAQPLLNEAEIRQTAQSLNLPWDEVREAVSLPYSELGRRLQVATRTDDAARERLYQSLVDRHLPEARPELYPGERQRRAELEKYLDEPQIEAQSDVPAQREAVESRPSSRSGTTAQETSTARGSLPETPIDVETTTRPEVLRDFGARERATEPQRFYHRDYGEVTESPNQKRVGKGRVRVTAEDGTEHVIKKANLSGAGNQRAVPLREPPTDKPLDTYLEPEQSAQLRERLIPEQPPETKPVETKPPESTTAVKNAAMESDRAARDLPELAQAEPRKAAEVHQRATDANAKDPRAVDRLTEQALATDKNFTDVETAQLRLRAQEIKNREAELFREIDKAADPQTIQAKRLELDSLTNEFDRLSQATKKAGTEWGRAGVARQQAIDQDFSLVAMKARLKAAKGENLTEKETARVEELYRRNVELEAKLDVAEKRLQDRQLQKTIEREGRSRRRAESKATLDAEFETLKQQLAQIKSQSTEGFFRSERGELDPEAAKIVAKIARNRIRAGVTNAQQLVDDVFSVVRERLPDATEREVRDAISGYGREPQRQQSELTKQLAQVRSELKRLSAAEDVEAGTRLSSRDKARQTQLRKQEADLQRRMAEGDFSETPRQSPRYTRETLELTKQLEQTRAEYHKMRYRATRGRGGMITDELAKLANVPKTLKSMGDISAVFRQGGYYSLTHPIEGLAKPTRDMLTSFSELGWRNVEAKIKADPEFQKLKDAGVEFTGVDKADPNLSRREEGFLGGEYLDYIPVAKQVKDVSERTFVSFLDAQRLYVGKQILKGMTEAQRNNPSELKAVAKLINAATGRGSLGRKGNQYAPALNIAMFSPRLLASRVQLLNNMINPVTIARMPPGARKQMIADNVKFLGATAAILGLMKAAGAEVSLDPDDAEFLKIRIGNTVYDQLTGLQQPLRYIVNMARAGSPIDSQRLQSGDYYAGKSMSEMSKQFARSKLNPALSPVVNFISGSDFEGRKFSATRELKDLAVPLPAQDVIEGLKEGGVIGGLQTAPTFVGIGTGSYPPAPDKPKTHAEKMARKITREKMPATARDDEEIETGRKAADLRARSRRGEDVSAEITKLGAKITERQAKAILSARNKTRLEEDVNRLGIKDTVRVYAVANAQQRESLKGLVERKAPLINTLPPDEQQAVRDELTRYGFQMPAMRISRPSRAGRESRVER